jgi:hypothetical protein
MEGTFPLGCRDFEDDIEDDEVRLVARCLEDEALGTDRKLEFYHVETNSGSSQEGASDGGEAAIGSRLKLKEFSCEGVAVVPPCDKVLASEFAICTKHNDGSTD